MDRTQLIGILRDPASHPGAGTALVGADLRGADLSRCALAHLDLTRAQLAGADLAGARLAHVTLAQADLRGADLTGAQLEFVDAPAADLTRCRGRLSSWRHVNLLRATLDAAGLSEAQFTGCTLTGASFSAADLSHGSIVDSSCVEARFDGADLRGVETVGTGFRRAALARARNFWGSHELVAEVLWQHVDTRDLEAVRLTGAVLLHRRWCYRDWHQYLTSDGLEPYYDLALDILGRCPASGAAQALEQGLDWRNASP